MNNRTSPTQSPTPDSKTINNKSIKRLYITNRKQEEHHMDTGQQVSSGYDVHQEFFGEMNQIYQTRPRKNMKANTMKVPQPVTPVDGVDIVPQIEKAERMSLGSRKQMPHRNKDNQDRM